MIGSWNFYARNFDFGQNNFFHVFLASFITLLTDLDVYINMESLIFPQSPKILLGDPFDLFNTTVKTALVTSFVAKNRWQDSVFTAKIKCINYCVLRISVDSAGFLTLCCCIFFSFQQKIARKFSRF